MSPIERDIRRFLIPVLRRASLRFKIKTDNGHEYPRTQVKQRARVERGLYKCASCCELFKESETIVDHIEPVIPLTGDTYNWNNFINALFVTADKLQILCKSCSDSKTLLEDNLRTLARQELRDKEKEEKLKIKLEKKKKKE